MSFWFKWKKVCASDKHRYARTVVQAAKKEEAIKKLWPDYKGDDENFCLFHQTYVFGPYQTQEEAQTTPELLLICNDSERITVCICN